MSSIYYSLTPFKVIEHAIVKPVYVLLEVTKDTYKLHRTSILPENGIYQDKNDFVNVLLYCKEHGFQEEGKQEQSNFNTLPYAG